MHQVSVTFSSRKRGRLLPARPRASFRALGNGSKTKTKIPKCCLEAQLSCGCPGIWVTSRPLFFFFLPPPLSCSIVHLPLRTPRPFASSPSLSSACCCAAICCWPAGPPPPAEAWAWGGRDDLPRLSPVALRRRLPPVASSVGRCLDEVPRSPSFPSSRWFLPPLSLRASGAAPPAAPAAAPAAAASFGFEEEPMRRLLRRDELRSCG